MQSAGKRVSRRAEERQAKLIGQLSGHRQRAAEAGASRARYTAVPMVPSTAMPSEPPKSAAVCAVAEAAPARSGPGGLTGPGLPGEVHGGLTGLKVSGLARAVTPPSYSELGRRPGKRTASARVASHGGMGDQRCAGKEWCHASG